MNECNHFVASKICDHLRRKDTKLAHGQREWQREKLIKVKEENETGKDVANENLKKITGERNIKPDT